MRDLSVCITFGLALIGCSGDGETNTKTNTNTNTIVEGASCDENDVCKLTGTILESLTLTADKQWVLVGGVFIGDDTAETVLTIEPGTVIYGDSQTGGFLTIRRGSKIIADGTADAPIVFTSSKAEGSRARGDWGGLILNGRAPINNCAATGDVCEQFGEGGTGFFGGSDPDDNSGVLRYVRVEFAGTLISPDNELNGIGFQGVGRSTTIDYIQVHMNADDGVEFFGGTAEWKHILVTGVGDDLLDWTDGWQGKGQFFVGQQYADSGDNGIEADNNGEDNLASPRSSPSLSHLTLIGSPGSEASDFGALLREGTAGDLHNVVFNGFAEACVSMANLETLNQVDAGALTIVNSIVDCDTSFLTDDENGDILDADIEAFFTSGDGNEAVAADLSDPYNALAPNFQPTAASAAITGGVSPSDAFFEAASFRGGVDPAADWTIGWTTSAAN